MNRLTIDGYDAVADLQANARQSLLARSDD